MSATHDILHLKTEAELRFFVENPSFYQAELVAAAQRELQRRGPGPASPAAPAPAASPAETVPPLPVAPRATAPVAAAASPTPEDSFYSYTEPPPTQRPWLLVGSVAAVCLLAGLGFWAKTPPPPAPPARAAARPAAPPQLEAAPASPIPTYDTDGYVEKALAQLPAAEKQNEQLVNQYRAVSRRFWAAQNPSAHLIRQAQQGNTNPVFGAQADLVLELWHDFDRTQVYSYSFKPAMADHLARMKVIAQYQREALKELTNDAEANRPPHLDDDQTLAHQQALTHLLAPLAHKTGPITVHL